METEDLSQLKNLAHGFRAAIEKCKGDLPINFSEFPRGSCGDASLLLGKYLEENGFGPLEYVAGWRDNWSHAWLELNDIIIDITADQFNEGLEPIIITKNHTWHKNFKENSRCEADFLLYDDDTVSILSSAYKRIISIFR